MEYNRIIAVTGLPGLFELVSSKTDGAIVRSLDDKTTKFVSSRVHNFSHLESIEIYTQRDNVNLVNVFQAMEKNSGKLPDGKDAGEVKTYFEKVFPDMDFTRVYSSDMKKMIKWFEVLKKSDVAFKLSEPPAEAVEEEVAVVEEVEEEKPAKTAKKKAAPKKEEADTATAEETEKPKKPAAKKKKAE
jgi:N-methylhydantoinase A/oxoprolinase/acetone carboxylase beta subunit